MLQLSNTTSYAARLLVLPNIDGEEAAVLIVQGTFELTSGRQAEIQRPLVEADVYVEPKNPTILQAASDITLAKPATDVLLEGVAYAPLGRAMPTFEASFVVGSIQKTVRIVGARKWHRTWVGIRLTVPEPVRAVPLSWTEALGQGAPPRLEHPVRPILRRKRQPLPWGGCGPIPPSWSPRREFAGTYDATWQRQRAPFVPSDFSPRFFQTAPSDQISTYHLQGGEPISLINCRQNGDVRTTVPQAAPRVIFKLHGSEQRPPLQLDTIRIFPDADVLSLVWRVVLPLGRRVLALRQVEVSYG